MQHEHAHLSPPRVTPADVAALTALDESRAWGQLRDLPEESPDPPDLPESLVPEAFRAYVQDVTERLATHRAFVGVSLVLTVGGLVGRRIGLHPKRHDPWLEVPNPWGAIVAPPSSNKSGAIAEATSPLQRLQRLAVEAFHHEQSNRGADIEMLKIELQTAKKDASKRNADKEEARARMADILAELNEAETTTPTRFIVNDATMEKLGELLQQNPHGLLYLRDELTGLLRACDKPGNETYRPFLLEAWNGTGSYTVDRIQRGTLHIEAHTLSILGGIQPGRLRSYIRDATNGGEGDDGLLQRFGMLVWFDRPATWRYVDRPQNHEARARVDRIFETLSEADFRADDDGDWRHIPALHFSDEAQEVFTAWLDQHMRTVRGDDLRHAPAFQAHLGKYPSLVSSLALLFHLIHWADTTNGHSPIAPVTFDAASTAIAWAAYLERHARKLYSVELDTALESARRLRERIDSGDVMDGQTIRSIYLRGWSRLTTRDEVAAALGVLEQVNAARIEKVPANTGDGALGGRPSEVIRLHPELRLT